MKQIPYTYRNDPHVPSFDDRFPLLVFDGVCVLCSGGAARLMTWDTQQQFRFATAQSVLCRALLQHYGCDAKNFNTVLLVSQGRAFTKSNAYIETARLLGGWWKFVAILGLVPQSIRDRLYDVKARNRYRWFGKTEYCALLTGMNDRLIDK